MKKAKLIGALLAGVMAFTGVPEITAPLTVTASAASKLAAPTGIKATVTDTAVKLTWNKVKGADAYRVFKYNSSTGKFETYKNVSGTSCNVTGLSAGKSYKFRIAALVKSGSSYSVQTKTSAVSAKTKLAAPKNVKATVSGSTVKLTWSKVSGASAYRVYTYDSASGKYKTVKDVSGTSASIKNLSAGTYKYKVAALVKSGSKYSAQAQSSAVSAKVAKSGSSSSSSSSSAMPISFPAFGTGQSAAVKAMNLTKAENIGKYSEDTYAYGGYKKINGQDCMVFMFFNSDKKFFYGAAVITDKAMSYSKIQSAVSSAHGKPEIDMSISGLELKEWVNASDDSAVALIGMEGGEGTMYCEISMKYAPASFKNGNSGNAFGNLDDIGSLLT